MCHHQGPSDTMGRSRSVGLRVVHVGLGLPGVVLPIMWGGAMKSYSTQEVAAEKCGKQWYSAIDVAALIHTFNEIMDQTRKIEELRLRMNTPVWLDPSPVWRVAEGQEPKSPLT